MCIAGHTHTFLQESQWTFQVQVSPVNTANLSSIDLLSLKLLVAKHSEEIAQLGLLVNVTDHIRDIRNDLQSNGDKIDDLGDDTDNLEEVVMANVEAQSERIDAVQSFAEEVNRELQDMKVQIDNQAEEINELKRLNEEKDAQIAELFELVNSQTLQVLELTEEVGRVANLAESETNPETGLDSLLTNFTTETTELKEQMEAATASIESVKRNVQRQGKSLQTLQKSVEEANEEQLLREQGINQTIRAVNQTLAVRLADVMNNVSKLDMSVADLMSRVELQELIVRDVLNDTSSEDREEVENVVETMLPNTPPNQDLQQLRAMVERNEQAIELWNLALSMNVSGINDRINATVLSLNETWQREFAKINISSLLNATGFAPTDDVPVSAWTFVPFASAFVALIKFTTDVSKSNAWNTLSKNDSCSLQPQTIAGDLRCRYAQHTTSTPVRRNMNATTVTPWVPTDPVSTDTKLLWGTILKKNPTFYCSEIMQNRAKM